MAIARHSRNARFIRSTRTAAIAALALLAGSAWVAAQNAAPRPPAAARPVARVGNYDISAAEFEAFARQFQAAFEQRAGQKIPASQHASFERSVLEQLIRQRLLRAEAHRRAIAVPDAEAERFLQASGPFHAPNGALDPAAWAAFKANPAYPQAMADARDLIGSQKLFNRLRAQFDPSDAQLRTIEADATQEAELRTLVVDTTWFESGLALTADSLRAHYRALAPQLTTPPRVRLELAVVPFPLAPGAAAPTEAARRQTQLRADSLRAAVRGGAPFDSAAAAFGGAREAGWWTAGQVAGVFFEDRKLGDEALAAGTGQVLGRTLAVPSGYAVVHVSAKEPGRAAPLAAVADSVARDWRRGARSRRAQAQLAEVRAAHPDDFRATCVQWHAALVDTGALVLPAPSEGKLRDWYRAHTTEFATLDVEGRGVTAPPYEQVREAVRASWTEAERWRSAQEIAAAIARAWGRDRRDSKAEKQARVWFALRSNSLDGPPAGVPRAAFDSVMAAPAGHADTLAVPGGMAVFAVTQRQESCEAAPEQEARIAAGILASEPAAGEEQAAREYFEAHRKLYPGAPTYRLTMLRVPPRPYRIVNIPKADIERYYRTHPDEFGQPEEVRVRHLLLVTPPGADTVKVLARAESLLVAARAGVPFDSLARVDSQDPSTRASGGDTGWFRRGMTSPEFEAVAFALRPGEIGGPVRSRFGFHLIQGVEKHEEKLTPLFAAQGVVGSKLASLWADSLARTGADSVLRVARSPRDFDRYVRERGYDKYTAVWTPGGVDPGPVALPEVQEDVRAMRRPGMVARVEFQSPDYYVIHVDSIVPADSATWENARMQVLADYRARERLAQAVQALEQAHRELAAGAPWDSVAAPWGGGLSFGHRRGMPVPGFEQPGTLDSVLFGSAPRRLAPGQSAILPGEHSAALVQLVDRRSAEATKDPAQREALRQAVLERRFYDYFEKLKRRYPVRILRADLRTQLPPPPAL